MGLPGKLRGPMAGLVVVLSTSMAPGRASRRAKVSGRRVLRRPMRRGSSVVSIP